MPYVFHLPSFYFLLLAGIVGNLIDRSAKVAIPYVIISIHNNWVSGTKPINSPVITGPSRRTPLPLKVFNPFTRVKFSLRTMSGTIAAMAGWWNAAQEVLIDPNKINTHMLENPT